jgi:hypothetical protein
MTFRKRHQVGAKATVKGGIGGMPIHELTPRHLAGTNVGTDGYGLAAGGVGFNPFTDLTDIIHGWRADLGLTLTGSAVDQWDDQVGNWDLLDGNTKPTVVSADLNGQDVIFFPGDGGHLTGGTGSIALPHFFAMVIEQLSWTLNDQFLSDNIDSSGLRQSPSTPIIQQNEGQNDNSNFTIGTYFLLRAMYSNNTTDYVQHNNETKVTGEATPDNSFTAPLYIGSNNGGASNRSAHFHCAEFIILDADLTGADATAYLAYITDRYGISM